jgi:hypothetical protein
MMASTMEFCKLLVVSPVIGAMFGFGLALIPRGAAIDRLLIGRACATPGGAMTSSAGAKSL